MTGALGRWRSAVAEQLRAAGLDAVEAMEPERARRVRGPVAAVALAGGSCGAGGFQDFLGTEEAEAGGRREAAERAAEELLFRGAAGVPVTGLDMGETEFLDGDGLYRLAARCRCGAWMTARAAEDGGAALTDFEIRGTMK